jgi:hypothetical protein
VTCGNNATRSSYEETMRAQQGDSRRLPDMTGALLVENIDPVAVELLSSAGYEVESLRGASDEADLAAALDGVQLLGIRSKTQVTRAVLQGRPGLTAVGAFCIASLVGSWSITRRCATTS